MPEKVFEGPDGTERLDIEAREFTRFGNAMRVVIGENEQGHKQYREIPWARIYHCEWAETYRTSFQK